MPLTALIAVLLCALLLPWQASSATAMTSTSASGYPGDVVEVTVGNQQSQRNATWVIDAPAGTTFAAPPTSSNPPGTVPFSCPLASPTQARCGPYPAWASGNRVTMQLLIGPNSSAGPTSGRTTLGSETADIPVTVLAPPAPPVTDPSPDAVTSDRLPAVAGTKRAGNAVAVTFADGQGCAVPADSSTTWTCASPAPLAFGATSISAEQTSPAGDVSPPTDRSFTVVDQLAITTPLDGDRTTSRSVTIAGGGALAGADVTVSVAGQSLTVVADGSGRWTVLATDLPIGAHPVTASWQVSGRTLTATPVTVTIAPTPAIILTPANGGAQFSTNATVTGTAEPNATVEVTLDAQSSSVTADSSGAWSLPSVTSLATGEHTITATQTVAGITSQAASSTFTVRPVAAPVITVPADGSRTTDRAPSVSGTAQAGATVTLDVDGRTLGAVAGSDGAWTVPGTTLGLGVHSVSATATIESVTSPRSPVTRFTVVAAPPPTPSPTSPPPTRAPTTPPTAPPTAAPRPSPGNGTAPRPRPTPTSVSTSPLVPVPARPTPATPRPLPAPGSDGAGPPPSSTPSTPSAPPPTPPPAPTAGAENQAQPDRPVAFNLAPARLVPGQVSSLSGILGPNTTSKPMTITLTGTVTKGLIYRSVSTSPAGQCRVLTTSFSCQLVLPPGQQATVTVRLLADALNAPGTARQQLTVDTGNGSTSNALTQTLTIDGGRSDTQLLAASVSSFPGPFIVLLALFLLALAATETERRRRRDDGT